MTGRAPASLSHRLGWNRLPWRPIRFVLGRFLPALCHFILAEAIDVDHGLLDRAGTELIAARSLRAVRMRPW